MISYALIKMVNTGLYGKALYSWNNLPVAYIKQRVEFRAFFVAGFERILIEGQGPTNSQEVYA